MTQYRIFFRYRAEDSLSIESIEEELGCSFATLELALENIRRIQDHYNWYSGEERSNFATSSPDWFVREYPYCIKLKLDNGNSFQMFAPWCGGQESLEQLLIVETSHE